MPDKILHKRNLTSNIAPTTSSLSVGELAINVADAKIFVKQSGSSGEFVRSVVTLDVPNTGSINLLGNITASYLFGTASNATSASYAPPTFIDNLVTVGLAGSDTNYNSIKTAVDSITDATATNTYTVRVYPGVYIENTITLKPYIAIKGDSSISTIVSASNPSASIFVMADQTMVIDMQIQGSTAPNVSAVVYSSPTTPQTNAIAYVENVRFGTNYTNAKVIGSGSSGNCILQCSNIKYGGFTEGSKSFDVGFQVTSGSDGGIGRMQLRNVTSTNGGVAGSSQDQIFALADAPGCTFIVNGCLLTRATGTATGTGFKVYNGGQLRLTAVNFQRWTRGIWAPQTGSAPSIDAIALNFENCTTDVDIQHTGSLGKVSGTDTFLKTLIAKDAPLYEVNQDPRRITVAKKGGDFTSISASVAYITDSAENNRYVIEVGPGEFTEKQIDMRGKPYIAILGSDIQTTVIIPSGSGAFDQLILGPTNEVSFLTLKGNNVAGYSALSAPDIGQIVSSDFAQVHKISIYNYDYGVKVSANTANSTFYGEYVDINGPFSYGVYVSSSNNFSVLANVENYYLFPSSSSGIGNYVVGPSSSLSLYTGLFKGDNTAGSTAIKIEQGASFEAAALDMQNWDYGVRVPAASPAPEFRIVGSMIHNSNIYDFDVLNTSTKGRYQGVASHGKINNLSDNFFWNFLDDTDGENDITRNLAVTFADGTHTDATTLIFKGSPMGVMEGGNITTGSGFNITVASGFGYVQDALDASVYKRIDWVNGNLTLTANSNNYIYLTSAEVLTAAGSIPNNETNIILGRVVTNNTGIELIDQTPYNGEHMSNKLSTFNREALGPVYAAGSTVTEDSTPFKLDVTAGTYFFSENKFTPSGTSSINLTQYYPSASAWARYTSSIVPSNQYASASALVAMSSSAYTKHTLYGVGEGVDEKYFLVINSNQYSTLLAAENANLPTIPTYFDDGVVALAAVYVQSGSANIIQIQDIRPIIGFRAAGVNASAVHGSLLGLSADDHTQYLLVNGTRAMAGNLSLGGNNITNVGTMFGTASWASNAISSSFATTSSFAVSALSASWAPTQATGSTAWTSLTGIPEGLVSSSVQINTGSFSGSFTGTLIGTSSWATTASFAISASWAPTMATGSTAWTSLTGIPEGLVSSSTQINTGSFSGSFVGTLTGTSSWATSASYVLPSGLPAGTVSSSGQVSYTGLSNVPANIVSSSAQVIAFLPTGTVSSSAQINTGSFTGSFIGIHSGSTFGTASWASNAISSSFATTSSYALSANVTLPAGVVSSSSQINTGSFTGSFIGIFSGSVFGTSSWASNVVSSSFATTASAATSITFTPATASFATTAATASSFTGYINFPNGLDVSGSLYTTGSQTTVGPVVISGSLNISGSVTASNVNLVLSGTPGPNTLLVLETTTNRVFSTSNITASLFGTSSWASNAISSSFATTASYALSAIATLPAGVVSSSQQFITLSDPFTGSFTGSFKGDGTGLTGVTATTFPFVGAAVISGSLTVTGSGITVIGGGITSSLFGTSSWASNSVSSSYPFAAGASSSLITANSGIGRPGISASYLGFGAGTASFDCDYSTFIGTAAARNGSFKSVYIGYQVAYDAVASNDSVMIGYLAGTQGGRNASNSNFIGSEAGAGDSGNFNNSNLLGYQAGYSASGAYNVVFIGDQAGFAARSAVDSTFVGDSAGFSASNAAVSTFLGSFAGYKAISASYSTFVGASAGQNATNPYNSTFIGLRTGFSASRASNSTFIGERAGELATDATGSTFIGLRAGFGASNARYSTFLGKRAGNNAVSASYSILIGDSSGYVVNSVDSMGSNNIVVGNSIGLPRNITDSINIGGIIFATGSYNNVAVQFTGSQSPSVAKVGINIVTPNYNFDVSGSGNFSNNLTVSGSLNATNGSITASNVNLVSISNTTNANSVLVLETATGKIFTTSSIGSTFPYTGNAVITGSLTITGSNALNITGSATILGAFQATTKSFKIDHQILLGKKLIYGVLEGPEHGVYVRGRLTKNNIIQLPEEWEWLVDVDSITVQLTPIGTQQILYVQNIENNTVVINSNTPIDCFYFVQATRKDVDTLQTVE